MTTTLQELDEVLASIADENDLTSSLNAERFLDDHAPEIRAALELQAKVEAGERILTCVYCGHEYPKNTPASGDQVLTDHIRTCAKHPLREAESTIEMLRSALVGVVGGGDPDQLREMEAVMRALPVPEEDKAVAINAIHALLKTYQEHGDEVTSKLTGVAHAGASVAGNYVAPPSPPHDAAPPAGGQDGQ